MGPQHIKKMWDQPIHKHNQNILLFKQGTIDNILDTRFYFFVDIPYCRWFRQSQTIEKDMNFN